jgi:hypothetical protein
LPLSCALPRGGRAFGTDAVAPIHSAFQTSDAAVWFSLALARHFLRVE